MEPSDSIIQLKVPDDAGAIKTFSIHRGVLCQSSDFFKRSMKPEWTENRADANVLDLPEETADVVSDYIKWLYSGTVQCQIYEANDNVEREERAKEAEKVFVVLAEAYVFGERILDVEYKNTIIEAISKAQRSSGWNMGPDSVDIVYKGTPSTSPLRRLIADYVAQLAYDDKANGIGWMSFFDEYPREALVDALKATVSSRKVVKFNAKDARFIDAYLEK